ncbi:MAG: Mur ligase family protein [Candidatus Wallbacteria bacterium]|nr:Mur ligase family protein [Candidatus Wallbacteria bacterium]
MSFSYSQALERLENIIASGIKYELNNIRKLLSLLGHPEQGYRIIHITGTKGKGSTGAILSGLLSRHVKTGFFSSPHLISPCERIRIGDQDLTEEEFSRNLEEIWPVLEETERLTGTRPTYFETLTALAFYSFKKAGVELAVVEVGLGGRLDATNAAFGDISVITRIHYDHVKILGNTLTAISREKSGIIKPGTRVVHSNRNPEVVKVIRKAAAKACAPLAYAPSRYSFRVLSQDHSGQRLSICRRGGQDLFSNVFFPLAGAHQLENLKVALTVLDMLQATGTTVCLERSDFSFIRWPGRLQKVSDHPLVLLDGAHNEISSQVLAAYLRSSFGCNRIYFLIGILADKNFPKFISSLLPMAAGFIVTEIDNKRKLPASDLAAEIRKHYPAHKVTTEPDAKKALSLALSLAKRDHLPLVVTGSLYLLGFLLPEFRKS